MNRALTRYRSVDAALTNIYEHAEKASSGSKSVALRSASDWIIEQARHDPIRTLSTLLLAYETMPNGLRARRDRVYRDELLPELVHEIAPELEAPPGESQKDAARLVFTALGEYLEARGEKREDKP